MKLTIEQQAWLDAHIASGEFTSAEEAFACLINDRMIDDADDLAWAAPYVAEAEEEIAAGDGITLEEHRARNAARFEALVKRRA